MKPYLWLCSGLLAAGCMGDAAANNDHWSLTLAEAQTMARERNHDLQLARTAIASAQANIEIAGAAPNPSLTLATSSINTANGGGGGNVWRRPIDTVLRVDQLIERGSKRALRTENAQQLALAAESDFMDVQRQLRSLVAQAYADLKSAQDKRGAAVEAARLLEAMLSAAQLRKAAGDIAGTDVERVRVDALRAQNDVSAADGELARARRTLALLMGVGEQVDRLEAVDAWPAATLPDALPQQQLINLITRRPDVRAASARLDAASVGSRLAQSLRTRDVSIGMQYEHYPQPGDPNSSNGNSVGFSVQVPLFTRYYYNGEIRSAEAARTTAEQDLLRVRALAENEIGSAWSSLLAAAERVRRNRDELLVAAEKAANAAEYAYKNGAVGVMDVLDARRTLRATRLDAFAALADFSKARAVWQTATEINEAPDTPQDSR